LCRWREQLLDGDGAKASCAQLLKSPSPERTQPPSRASAAGLGEKSIEVSAFPSARGAEMKARRCVSFPVRMGAAATLLGCGVRRGAAQVALGGGARNWRRRLSL
jgi:hypothetical protein